MSKLNEYTKQGDLKSPDVDGVCYCPEPNLENVNNHSTLFKCKMCGGTRGSIEDNIKNKKKRKKKNG
ncbi:MAG: hypothetical protein AABY22_09960 [Nanoarchaeota archaeon]